MKAIEKLLALFCILASVTLACSFTVDLGSSPASTPTHPVTGMDQVSTMVAQTLQALTQEALAATPANTSTPTATATPTNTPLPPSLSVSVATNCYAGPSTHYGFVITIYPGTTVTVVGKDPADNYWIIDVPGYPGTLCWLSGQYAAVNGDTIDLSVPATTVIVAYTLSEPTNLRVSCTRNNWPTPTGTPPWHGGGRWGGGQETAVLRWRNTDPDQTGVRVYRDGHRIATLGRGATSYTDSFSGWGWGWHWDDGVTYGVQAFNSYEVSSIVSVDAGNCR
ncbi:MAG TPA: hypothetical protein VLZ89_05475 [Anaerolineales bacterium]|nr:hypothetical protein [Anaerolineales bacterium]